MVAIITEVLKTLVLHMIEAPLVLWQKAQRQISNSLQIQWRRPEAEVESTAGAVGLDAASDDDGDDVVVVEWRLSYRRSLYRKRKPVAFIHLILSAISDWYAVNRTSDADRLFNDIRQLLQLTKHHCASVTYLLYATSVEEVNS